MERAGEDKFQQVWKSRLMDCLCLNGHGWDPSDFGFKVGSNSLRAEFYRFVSQATVQNMDVGGMTETQPKVERRNVSDYSCVYWGR